jgi:hypothetical protein
MNKRYRYVALLGALMLVAFGYSFWINAAR